MAAELSLRRTPARTVRRFAVYREGSRAALRRKAGICCKVGAILIVTVCGTLAVLIHNSYRSFTQLIDQQIAGGYLRSHAGIYAAPRTIEKGARLSRDQLATSLQRAGYARDQASNVWNGSFHMSEDRIRILPRQRSETHQWIDIKFDNPAGRVASLSADNDAELLSYAVEPELLTVDASLKTGQQETLTFQEIPPVLVQAILAIEDRRFFNHYGYLSGSKEWCGSPRSSTSCQGLLREGTERHFTCGSGDYRRDDSESGTLCS